MNIGFMSCKNPGYKFVVPKNRGEKTRGIFLRFVLTKRFRSATIVKNLDINVTVMGKSSTVYEPREPAAGGSRRRCRVKVLPESFARRPPIGRLCRRERSAAVIRRALFSYRELSGRIFAASKSGTTESYVM